jgi:hypothetical protein
MPSAKRHHGRADRREATVGSVFCEALSATALGDINSVTMAAPSKEPALKRRQKRFGYGYSRERCYLY